MNRRIVATIIMIFVLVVAMAAKKSFTLVIDPGHGGHDAGAIGAFSKEKNINLNVALAFGRLVENNCSNVKVVYTRKTDERILRRVARDIRERGRSLESVINQYLTTVKPMHYLYVEPTKTFADLILNSGRNDVAFDVMKTKIEALLGEG